MNALGTHSTYESAIVYAGTDQDEAALPALRSADLTFRAGSRGDAAGIVRLIEENLEGGHLLPRGADEVAAHAHRFVVIADGPAIVGCAELAPLSGAVAEVRSLVVDAAWRGVGLGPRLITTLQRQARLAGFSTLCALTHEPGRFVRLGFSIVPHVWFPEKIAADCTSCAKFRVCGQFAVALSLRNAPVDSRRAVASGCQSPRRQARPGTSRSTGLGRPSSPSSHD
jgi:N-acetylglutamate synthase-like GNAT family acetyltransferase